MSEEGETVENVIESSSELLKAQVVSDLHLEMGGVFDEVKDLIPVKGDILILPGDIGILGKDDFTRFFEWASENFKYVLYIPGNHEFYHHEYFSAIDEIKAELKNFDNVHVLYQTSIVIAGIRFVGTTFWTYPPNKQRQDMVYYRYNDYRQIDFKPKEEEKERKLTVYDTMDFHLKDRSWLESEFDKARENQEICYVITHHVPLLGLKFLWTGERHLIQRDIWYGNCTDESELIFKNMDVVKAWFHGHTHKSLVSTFRRSDIKNKVLGSELLNNEKEEVEGEEEEEENIWIISNQVGYRDGRDESDYNKDLLLDIPLPKPEKIEYPPIMLEGENMEIWGEMEVVPKEKTKVEPKKEEMMKKNNTKDGKKECNIL